MRCPFCHSTDSWKWNVPSWAWFPPGTMKNRRCNGCGHEYIAWLCVFPLPHSLAHFLVIVWHWAALIIGGLFAAFCISLLVS